jgi:hypothetical protein
MVIIAAEWEDPNRELSCPLQVLAGEEAFGVFAGGLGAAA